MVDSEYNMIDTEYKEINNTRCWNLFCYCSAEPYYAECPYAKCRSAECHAAHLLMPSKSFSCYDDGSFRLILLWNIWNQFSEEKMEILDWENELWDPRLSAENHFADRHFVDA